MLQNLKPISYTDSMIVTHVRAIIKMQLALDSYVMSCRVVTVIDLTHRYPDRGRTRQRTRGLRLRRPSPAPDPTKNKLSKCRTTLRRVTSLVSTLQKLICFLNTLISALWTLFALIIYSTNVMLLNLCVAFI